MESKHWVFNVLGLYFVLICFIIAIMVIIDPYFHFHAPIGKISYTMEVEDDMYINDGIIKNFDYNMIIIGASTTNGFSTTLADELFNAKSIRVTFQGEGFKGINDRLQTAVDTHPDLKLVIRGIDTRFFFADENWMGHEEYPEYLYDNNLLNDVYYIFNGEILCNKVFPEIVRTIKKEPAMDFDFYIGTYGKEGNRESVLSMYKNQRPQKDDSLIDDQETEQIYQNLDRSLQKNVIDIIEENPNITFYLFFPPNSILWWDSFNQLGGKRLERRIQLEKYAIEKLLPYDNVHLFSFTTNHEWICNLDNYGDYQHYTSDACAQIMKWMKDGKYELTEENYMEYIDDITEFLSNYDYNAIFEE